MKWILNYVVLAFCFKLLDGAKFRCDYKYANLGWFKYHEIPTTWNTARLQCQLEGGILASPTTEVMKTIMLALFCKPEIFTGIHATFSEALYYTVDGMPLSEIPHTWAPNEPDNKNNAESCLTLNSKGKLADVRCDKPHPYICFKDHTRTNVSVCGTTDPEYHFYAETNKCYKFHTSPRTFSRAHLACSAEGGHLAIINSDEEAKVIAGIFAKYPKEKLIGNFYKDIAFIGFSNWGESADWTTIHGQTLQDAGYAKFAQGQPDNASGEYCGSVMRNGFLNDAWCTQHYAFICEKSFDYPAVCDNANPQGVLNYFHHPHHRPRVCDDDVENNYENKQPDNSDVRNDNWN